MNAVATSSITTAVPIGPIEQWCVASPESFEGKPYECANHTQGTTETDFQTFCCDGEIINVVRDFWRAPFWNSGDRSMKLADMVCCGLGGAPQQGGIGPIPTVHTSCAEGSPTPLASLAATNTANAAPFRVTYTSASYGGDGTVGDFIPTQSPSCFWAYTVGVAMSEVTVPAADITTLSSSSAFFYTVPTTTRSRTTTAAGSESGSIGRSTSGSAAETTVPSGSVAQTGSGTSSAASPTRSSVASRYTGVRKGYVYVGVGLVALSLLWS
ncbi:hypothetical protein GGR54DRAFT_449491 [Hypoxylon sp. NC1633]|nr:hypothetical protein GGR54DRAFT_449491 [Hypoxylon sp. NC1633]